MSKPKTVALIILSTAFFVVQAFAEDAKSHQEHYLSILRGSSVLENKSVVAILPAKNLHNGEELNNAFLDRLVDEKDIAYSVLTTTELFDALQKINADANELPTRFEKIYVESLKKLYQVSHLLLSELEIIEEKTMLTSRLLDLDTLSVVESRYDNYSTSGNYYSTQTVEAQVETLHGERNIDKTELKHRQCVVSVNAISCDFMFTAIERDVQYKFENIILFDGNQRLTNTVQTISIPSSNGGFSKLALNESTSGTSPLRHIYLSVEKYHIGYKGKKIEPVAVLDYSVNNRKYRIVQDRINIKHH